MHSLRLNIEDSIFDKVINYLSMNENYGLEENSDVMMFSNHSVNSINEWKDDSEDEIWK